MTSPELKSDVIVVGAGLAGLTAACELVDAGKRVLIIDQEPEASLGGQAHWSLGGLMFVDSPEQRRARVKDSFDLAWQDWIGTAGFDRPEDEWPKKWAEAYVNFASGEKRAWLSGMGMKWIPSPGWPERGGHLAGGHGNSVPRFHITWGTGPGVLEPFLNKIEAARVAGSVEFAFRHRVDELELTDGTVTGVSGAVLEPSAAGRGEDSSRVEIDSFSAEADAVLVTSGGIGGNFDLVRENWPERLGPAPEHLIRGVPVSTDGRMLGISERAGAHLIGSDRMWHYTEGIRNWAPVWSDHAIRILPGPSPLWFDATGERMPLPCLPGFDTIGTMTQIGRTGHDHSWFILNERIIAKEFALSGSEQNPDVTGKSVRRTINQRVFPNVPDPVRAFMNHGPDFVVKRDLRSLVDGMNAISHGGAEIDLSRLEQQIIERDREVSNPFSKDMQIVAINGARKYFADRVTRVAKPHEILDTKAGPLIAVKLNLLTRKTLGGIQTDLDGRALRADGTPLPGLYAAGEVSGFGGGGMHGYRALEGTFLGGCLFSGRVAGRAAAAALGSHSTVAAAAGV
ncbi:MAG: FAD-binding dehydrogenase [Solirubrobacterales bacterium]